MSEMVGGKVVREKEEMRAMGEPREEEEEREGIWGG